MANVLITGGSRGIGAACVRRFAQAGHRVWFLYEKEHTAAQAIAAETGAEPICADVADGEAVRAAFRRCPDVDILVCNAGISVPGLMSMLSEESWDRLFDVNEELGPALRCERQGHVPLHQRRHAELPAQAGGLHRDGELHVGRHRRQL